MNDQRTGQTWPPSSGTEAWRTSQLNERTQQVKLRRKRSFCFILWTAAEWFCHLHGDSSYKELQNKYLWQQIDWNSEEQLCLFIGRWTAVSSLAMLHSARKTTNHSQVVLLWGALRPLAGFHLLLPQQFTRRAEVQQTLSYKTNSVNKSWVKKLLVAGSELVLSYRLHQRSSVITMEMAAKWVYSYFPGSFIFIAFFPCFEFLSIMKTTK